MRYQNYLTKPQINTNNKYSLKKRHPQMAFSYHHNSSASTYQNWNNNHLHIEENLNINKRSAIISNNNKQYLKTSNQQRLKTENYQKVIHDQSLSTVPSFQNPFVPYPQNLKQSSIIPLYPSNIQYYPSFLTQQKPQQLNNSNKSDINLNINLYNNNNKLNLRQQKYLHQKLIKKNNKLNQEHRAINNNSINKNNKKLSLKKSNFNQLNQNIKSNILVNMSYQHLQYNSVSNQVFVKQKRQKQRQLYKLRQKQAEKIRQKQRQKMKDYQLYDCNTKEQLQSKHINKIINNLKCSINNNSKNGCYCNPKCYWINKWLNIINNKSRINYDNINNSGKMLKKSIIMQEIYNQIQKDVPRTYPQNISFQNQQLQLPLKHILIQYAKLDMEVGYVQGMNFLAAVLVYHSSSNQESLTILIYIMKQLNFRRIFINNLSAVDTLSKAFLFQLRRLSYDLYSHLINQNINIQLFIKNWYFSLFGNFVPLKYMHLVIQKYLNRQFAGLNQIILTFFLYMKNKFMEMSGHELQICFTNHMISQFSKQIEWDDLIGKSQNLKFQTIIF